MCTDIVILAGGSGERLWPVSDIRKPKQFMAITGEDSFLQMAITRALSLAVEGEIFVVTRPEWTKLVIADLISLSDRMGDRSILSKVLVMNEPCGKNTAPPIVWIARYLLGQKRTHPANILLMASDHIIKPIDAFVSDVTTAAWYAERDNLVSFAIPPAFPATGYGYIKAGKSLLPIQSETSPAFTVDTFREKPDAATARQYLDDGHYYWNSGIYVFRAGFYLSEIERHSPEVYAAFEGLGSQIVMESHEGVRVITDYEGLSEAYDKSPSISIDYAVSEKCQRSVAIRASFLWDDVGTWDSVAKYFDELPTNAVSVDSKNCFVHSDIPVALCGVDDLVVVIKNGKALVARKGETNLVKDALGLFREKESQ